MDGMDDKAFCTLYWNETLGHPGNHFGLMKIFQIEAPRKT